MNEQAIHQKKRWFRLGTIAMMLLGFGISLIGEAITLKASGASIPQWVALGTISIAVFNAGICVFGEAILCKIRYERWKEKEVGNAQ